MNTQHSIVIIEDDFDDQYLLKSAIQKLPYDVNLDMYSSGKEYYEQLVSSLGDRDKVPDIIFLDLNLPGWDGKKTLKLLRSHQEINSVPIIIYTTSRSQTDMDDAYALGASSYIVKAMSFDKIERNIKLICEYWLELVGVQARSR